jgi:hypothetical protein
MTTHSYPYTRDPVTGLTSSVTANRPLSAIARDIKRNWPKVYFGAVPYLDAMCMLDTIADSYGQDSAKSIVLYFLGNATTWHGPEAKRIKTELKSMVK